MLAYIYIHNWKRHGCSASRMHVTRLFLFRNDSFMFATWFDYVVHCMWEGAMTCVTIWLEVFICLTWRIHMWIKFVISKCVWLCVKNKFRRRITRRNISPFSEQRSILLIRKIHRKTTKPETHDKSTKKFERDYVCVIVWLCVRYCWRRLRSNFENVPRCAYVCARKNNGNKRKRKRQRERQKEVLEVFMVRRTMPSCTLDDKNCGAGTRIHAWIFCYFTLRSESFKALFYGDSNLAIEVIGAWVWFLAFRS